MNDFNRIVTGVFGVTNIEPKEKKDGTPYAMITLSDGVTKVTVSDFNDTVEQLNSRKIVEGEIVNVRYEINGQYKNLSCIDVAENVTPEIIDRLALKAPGDRRSQFETIINVVMRSANPKTHTGIAKLTERLLRKEENVFMWSSAAMKMHHAEIGGLCYHTYRMVYMAERICEAYPELDRELLICATALHDIGKAYTYQTNRLGGTNYSVYGILFEHLVVGSDLIRDMALEFGNNIDGERVALLRHIVLAHHGTPEMGAVKPPVCPEAAALYCIDMLDSRVEMFNNAYNNIEGGCFSEHINGLNSRVYKASYRSNADWQ